MTPPTPRWLARHIAAAHDTNLERESFAPGRLSDAALRAEFDPAGAAAAAAAAAVTPAAVAANLPARLSDTALRAAFVPGRVLNANGSVNAQKKVTVKLTADGLDIDDIIIESVA